MIYQAYQAYADMMHPLRTLARSAAPALLRNWPGATDNLMLRKFSASCEVLTLAGLTHARPPFNLAPVKVGNREVAIVEEVVHSTPFCTLLRFTKDISATQPRVLVVAPMSGHFATLLRGTVQTLVRDHDVYITDWHNARDISLLEGRFDLEGFIAHIIEFLGWMGPGAHLLAVCQPAVPALAAVAVMAADKHPAQPVSMTLMAGPIDTRINPTEVNKLATSKPIEWFETHLIGTVPMRYPGAFRRVYPGFMQIAGFMSMNLDRHLKSFLDYYNHLVAGDEDKAEAVREFYEEYFAMMDLTAEFYIQTVRDVFQEHLLPQGKMTFNGQPIEPRAIRRTHLLTVEGERDDICAIGQTLAAQDLCSGLRPYMKQHHVQTGVGHYGVFNGRRWEKEVYPLLRDFIHMSE